MSDAIDYTIDRLKHTKCLQSSGKPSIRKSHKTGDFFHTGGAQSHSVAFGGVFSNITEAIFCDEISTKVRIHPPKVITLHQNL